MASRSAVGEGVIELLNSKTTELPTAKDGRRQYSLDGFIGAVQMLDPTVGKWQDIKPRLVRESGGYHIEEAPYYAKILDNGERLFCPDKNEQSKYLRIPTMPLITGLAKNIISTETKLDRDVLPSQIQMPTDWGFINISFSNTGMHFEILLNKSPGNVFGRDSPRILLDVDSNHDIVKLLKATEGLGIPRPSLIELNSGIDTKVRWLDWSFKNGQLELGFDLSGLNFPILLKNTTVSITVNATTDDGFADDYLSGSLTTNNNYYDTAGIQAATHTVHAFHRFTGVTIPDGSTINVGGSYLTGYWLAFRNNANISNRIYFNDVADAVAPTTYALYMAKVLTTQYSAWNATASRAEAPGNSPTFVAIIQELMASYSYAAGAAMMALIRNNGTTGTYNYLGFDDYFRSTTNCATLHIEYTPPVTFTPYFSCYPQLLAH